MTCASRVPVLPQIPNLALQDEHISVYPLAGCPSFWPGPDWLPPLTHTRKSRRVENREGCLLSDAIAAESAEGKATKCSQSGKNGVGIAAEGGEKGVQRGEHAEGFSDAKSSTSGGSDGSETGESSESSSSSEFSDSSRSMPEAAPLAQHLK